MISNRGSLSNIAQDDVFLPSSVNFIAKHIIPNILIALYDQTMCFCEFFFFLISLSIVHIIFPLILKLLNMDYESRIKETSFRPFFFYLIIIVRYFVRSQACG